MKRIKNILKLVVPCLFLMFISCELFQIDNYDRPNASFSGSIKDELTGELVGTDTQNGSDIRAYELGWGSRQAQIWVIKQTGEFQNDLVFSGQYDLMFNENGGNFFPFSKKDFEIKKGANQCDFTVTPFIRIKDVSITYNSSEKKIVATFKLQAGKPEVKLSAIRLYGFSDMYVGEQVKFATTGTGFSSSFSPAKVIDASEIYTLSIDMATNANLFKYRYDGYYYYFRVGALANISGVGTVRHNYSATIKINSKSLN